MQQVRRGGEETVTVPAAGGNLIGVRDHVTTPITTTSETSTKRGKARRYLDQFEYRLDYLSIEPLSAQTMNAVGVCEIFVVGTASQPLFRVALVVFSTF